MRIAERLNRSAFRRINPKLSLLFLIVGGVPAAAQVIGNNGQETDQVVPLHFQSNPVVTTLATVPTGADLEAISDIAVADLDGDGRNDLIIAWFITDFDDLSHNQRFLSILWGSGTFTFDRTDIDLYIPDDFDPLSIFRNGTSSIAVGDFDGDGDRDIAVLPFFGDELWIFENLGHRQFTGYLKYPFLLNTTGNFITPPRALAADFNGDGRDDLVYVVDPQFYPDGRIIHFWSTPDTIANMDRVYWEPLSTSLTENNTHTLAVADLDGDGRPDLCFSGSAFFGNTQAPVLNVWTNFNPLTGGFTETVLNTDFLASEIAVLPRAAGCRPSLMLFDPAGVNAHIWNPTCSGSLAYSSGDYVSDLVGGSYPQGVAACPADVNANGGFELIVRQKLGPLDQSHKLDVIVPNDNGGWETAPASMNASGFAGDPSNPLLQPRDLVVADLVGNRMPELIAAWGPAQSNPAPGTIGTLRIAIWQNDCLGDVSRDGHTDMIDLNLALAHFGQPASRYPDADLNKDGIIDLSDLLIVLSDYGCH